MSATKFILKFFSIVFTIFVFLYLCFALCACVISTSPNDFNELPRTGIWVSKTDDYVFTIDFTACNEDKSVTDNMVATIKYGGEEYILSVSISGGHGTPLVPVAPSTILYFDTDDSQDISIHFCTSQYRINDDGFSYLNIYCLDDHNFSPIKNRIAISFVPLNDEMNEV